ncbi:MAG: hypothetical protein JWM12_1005 [Ilumatobacteraceae bacterium]|nr:hypothetical protein [Ilumatobacteraceae bacterium]
MRGDLTEADVAQLTSADVRLQDSTLHGLVGATSRRAAVIDAGQVLPRAYAMFESPGIRERDERSPSAG